MTAIKQTDSKLRARTRRLLEAVDDHSRGRFDKQLAGYDWQEPAGEAYVASEGEPYRIRVARAQAASWTASNPQIGLDELIVGAERPPRAVSTFYPVGLRCNFEWAERIIEETGSPEYAARLRKMIEALRGTLCDDRIEAECRKLGHPRRTPVYWAASFQGHMVLDYAKLLRRGLDSLVMEARHWRKQHEDQEKKDTLSAAIILGRGLQEFIGNYGTAAVITASGSRGARGEELREIVETCRRVTGKSARSFREALQLFWFAFVYDGSDNPGRLDQWLFPYYEADLRAGRLTRDEAEELVEAFWVKFSQARGWNIALGGQTAEGKDATNELTYLCLEVTERLRLPSPNVSVRFFSGTPLKLRERAVEVIGAGMGMPAIYNDEVIVPALTAQGIALEDARDYAFGGCTEIQIPGKSNLGGEDANLNLGKCLELALNDGLDPMTGEQLGPHTGDAREFGEFEDLYGAFVRQVEHATEAMIAVTNAAQRVRSECGAKLFRMLLTEACLERGLDPDGGGAVYGQGEVMTLGIAVCADSLAAIRRFVYDERSLTMGEVLAALAEDFEGQEALRRRLIRDAPKYGNDDDEADELAARVARDFWTLLKGYQTHRGGPYGGGVIVLGRNVAFGAQMGSTPDGRLAGRPVEDSIGPRAGMATRGASAALKSAAKIDQTLGPMGVLYNLTLTADMFTEATRPKVRQLIEGYFAAGGQQVQVTVASREQLLAAQRDPESHRDLMVRVGGYSDYFVKLAPELQSDIIARAEQMP